MQVGFQSLLSVRLPAPLRLQVQAADISEHIAALPATSGIYLLSASGKPPHISWSANLPRRLKRLLFSSPTGSTSVIGQFRRVFDAVECWPTGSKLETSLLLYRLTKTYFPADYLFRLRLRMPWLVGLTESDPFPRVTVTKSCCAQIGRAIRSVPDPRRSPTLSRASPQSVPDSPLYGGFITCTGTPWLHLRRNESMLAALPVRRHCRRVFERSSPSGGFSLDQRQRADRRTLSGTQPRCRADRL